MYHPAIRRFPHNNFMFHLNGTFLDDNVVRVGDSCRRQDQSHTDLNHKQQTGQLIKNFTAEEDIVLGMSTCLRVHQVIIHGHHESS